MSDEIERLRELLQTHKARLHELEITRAKFGIDTRPHVLTEISELEQKIQGLEERIQELEVERPYQKEAEKQFESEREPVSRPRRLEAPEAAAKEELQPRRLEVWSWIAGIVAAIVAVITFVILIYPSLLFPSANHPPTISDLSVRPAVVEPGKTTEVEAVGVHDPDGDKIKYIWDVWKGTLDFPAGGNPETSPVVEYTPPEETGTYFVNLTVDDGKGGVANKSVTVRVE